MDGQTDRQPENILRAAPPLVAEAYKIERQK